MPRYSTEFKEQAVCLLHQGGISKACRELHITRATLYRWNKELKNVISVTGLDLLPLTDEKTDNIVTLPTPLSNEGIESISNSSKELQKLREEVNAQIAMNRLLKKALITILSDGEAFK